MREALDHPPVHVSADTAFVVEVPMLAPGVEDPRWPTVRILDDDVGDPLAAGGEFRDGVALRQAAERTVFGEEVVAEGDAHQRAPIERWRSKRSTSVHGRLGRSYPYNFRTSAHCAAPEQLSI